MVLHNASNCMQYGEEILDGQMKAMYWDTTCSYLKQNPVTSVHQNDHVFKNLWGKVVLNGTHPIG